MRGFAFTAHCPRCETAHPTGAEVTPIITCRRCGLGFDPKPREPQPADAPGSEPVELVRVDSQIVEQVTNADVHLVIRDSPFHGVWLLCIAVVLVLLGYTALGLKEWAYLVVLAGLAPAAAYGGISHLFGRTYVYVNRDTISAWQEPLPRFRERMIGGDIATLSLVERTGKNFDLVATEAAGERRSLRLLNADEELANELAAAIRKHRARLGAPIRDE